MQERPQGSTMRASLQPRKFFIILHRRSQPQRFTCPSVELYRESGVIE